MRRTGLIVFALGSVACAHRMGPMPPPADHVEVDLLRSQPGAEKIYVQARLPDGQLGLFMVDTGAGITAITQDLADRLGIEGKATGRSLQGLGGEAPLIQGTLESLAFEGLTLGSLEVAVGVPGIPTHAGWMPIDGILGNNVWGQLVLGIDYPANRMEISLPGAQAIPADAQDIFFDGRHIVVETVVVAGEPGEDAITRSLHLELDTGARGILLSGNSGQGFESLASEGEEPIFGVGASEDVPVSAFYRETRHVPIQEVHLGGQKITSPITATWINYSGGTHLGPRDLTGLIGHSVLANHTVWIDFPNRKLALVDSQRDARPMNGHQVLLEQDQRRYRRRKDRGLFRAKMHLASDERDLALKELARFLKKAPNHSEAISLLARIHRVNGDTEAYFQTLNRLPAKDLAQQGELVGAVVTLLLDGRFAEADALTTKALFTAPHETSTHLALFEVNMHQGDHPAARSNLHRAMTLKENPDAFLMRRSRLSLKERDVLGTASLLRRRLALYPSDGFALWAYGLSIPESKHASTTYEIDMNRALHRLHSERIPLDFAAAATLILGQEDRSTQFLESGLERDCQAATVEQETANCEAWYLAMANSDLDTALEKITRALELAPHRSDFLDTLAVVQWRRDNLEAAEQAALAAVRLSPSDTYHLWQLDRIRVIRDAQRSQP